MQSEADFNILMIENDKYVSGPFVDRLIQLGYSKDRIQTITTKTEALQSVSKLVLMGTRFIAFVDSGLENGIKGKDGQEIVDFIHRQAPQLGVSISFAGDTSIPGADIRGIKTDYQLKAEVVEVMDKAVGVLRGKQVQNPAQV